MADVPAGAGAFAGDDGSADPVLRRALDRYAARGEGLPAVVAALAGSRLLVPLLEVDGDLLDGDDSDPCAGADRAVAAVSVRTPDGALGLAFTGMDALAAWRAEARPMPVAAEDVARALLAEDAVGLQLDVAGPHCVLLPPLALSRLAAGGAWPDAWVDPAVRQAVATELAPVLASGEVQVRLAAPPARAADDLPAADGPPDADADVLPAPPDTDDSATARAGLVVEVRFLDGLSEAEVATRARIVADRLASSALLRQAFDGVLAVRVV